MSSIYIWYNKINWRVFFYLTILFCLKRHIYYIRGTIITATKREIIFYSVSSLRLRLTCTQRDYCRKILCRRLYDFIYYTDSNPQCARYTAIIAIVMMILIFVLCHIYRKYIYKKKLVFDVICIRNVYTPTIELRWIIKKKIECSENFLISLLRIRCETNTIEQRRGSGGHINKGEFLKKLIRCFQIITVLIFIYIFFNTIHIIYP